MNRKLKEISFIILLILINIAFYSLYKSFNNIDKNLSKIEHKVQKSENNTKSLITKHSVHPYYGNYIKVDENGNTCHPWQYCPGYKHYVYDISLMRKI